MQRQRRFLKNQQDPRDAHCPAFGTAHGERFGKYFATDEREREERENRQRGRPMHVDNHAQRDGEQGGVGESVAERERGQQILRLREQLGDDFAATRFFFDELGELPFAEGKERSFRQREKEARARENQNRQHGLFHARGL